MDDPHIRNDPIGRDEGRRDIPDEATPDRPGKGGDPDSLDVGQGPEPLLSGTPLQSRQEGQRLGKLLLPLADAEGIHEESQGGRDIGPGTSGQDQRVRLAPALAPDRDPPQVQDGQKVGGPQLVLKGHPQDIELPQGTIPLQGAEGATGTPEGRLHVDPGRVDPLRVGIGKGLQKEVEDLEAQVGHAHLVNIGKGQAGPDQSRGIRLRGTSPPFPTHVAGGALHPGKKGPQGIFGENGQTKTSS
jgi:hypothetical protein